MFQESFENTGNWTHRCHVFPVGGQPYQTDIGNIFVPQGWTFWFLHQPGTLDQPEGHHIAASVDKRRVRTGTQAYMYFWFFRKGIGGLYRRFAAKPGQRVRVSAYAHAWSNGLPQHLDDPFWSEWAGREVKAIAERDVPPLNGDPVNDAAGNILFDVGIDPTGGTDPRASTVVWGPAYAVYNGYCQELQAEAVAQADQVTVFLRARVKWSFKHNDCYWDDVRVSIEDAAPQPPTPPPQPQPASETNKHGFHVLRGASGLDRLIAARPAVMKFVGDFGHAASVPPETLTIGRLVLDWDAQGDFRLGLTPRESAEKVLRALDQHIASNPRIQYWEGHNEPVWNTPEQMAWYMESELWRARLLKERYGKGAVVGNFATGTPELSLWAAAVPFIKQMLAEGLKPILGLHEYSCPWMWWMTGKHQVDPREDQGDEGWTTLRYRKVYRQFLIPAGAVLPLVVTECGIDPLVGPNPHRSGTWKQLARFWQERDGKADAAAYYAEQLIWYERELRKDPYVVGYTLFTVGSYGIWADFDIAGTAVVDHLEADIRKAPARGFVWEQYAQQALPQPQPQPLPTSCTRARVPYARRVVLLPQEAGRRWFVCAAIGAHRTRTTILFSADDAGIGCGLESKEVVAVRLPGCSWGDLEGFFRQHYPDTRLTWLSPQTPSELAVMLLPPLQGDIALSQRDPRWANEDLGEEPGGETIGEAGCLLTCLAMMLRQLTGIDVLPPDLNAVLAEDRRPFTNDDLLTNWSDLPRLFPSWFSEALRTTTAPTLNHLRDLLGKGWLVTLARSDGGHFVYLEAVNADGTLRVVDPWYGSRRSWTVQQTGGVRALLPKRAPTVQPVRVLAGLHDESGGAWLTQQGKQGLVVCLATVQKSPVALDYMRLKQAGHTVICRLGWGYADGSGTIARPADLDAHCAALAETLRRAKGVDWFILWNEPNNVMEWPGWGSNALFELTPQYIVQAYNKVWNALDAVLRQKLMPPPVDPYFGPGSDNSVWWKYILGNIAGAGALALHCKTQTNDPAEVTSTAKFSDDPLRWQFLHFRTLETSLAMVPARFRGLPVFITEANPQHLDRPGGTLGWKTDSAPWVRAVMSYLRDWNASGGQQVHGVVFYRYEKAGDQAPFGLADKPAILQAIAEACG